MRSRRVSFLSMVGLLAVTGCTAASPPVDADELQAWIEEHPVDEDPDALAGFTGSASPAHPDEPGGYAVMDLTRPVAVDEAELVCFGSGRVSVEIEFTSLAKTTSVAAEGVPCAEGAHPVAGPELALGALERVRVRVYDATGETAWRVVLRGREG